MICKYAPIYLIIMWINRGSITVMKRVTPSPSYWLKIIHIACYCIKKIIKLSCFKSSSVSAFMPDCICTSPQCTIENIYRYKPNSSPGCYTSNTKSKKTTKESPAGINCDSMLNLVGAGNLQNYSIAFLL